MLMPQVVRIPLHLPRYLAHFGQGYGLGIVIYVALKHLQHIKAIARVGDKRRKQNVETVVDGNKFVPVLNCPA